LLLGCASKPQEEDTFTTDMTQYLAKARTWVAAETKVNDAVVAVRRDQFVHDDLTIEQLKPALDVIKTHIDDLEKYQPRTPRVQDAHQRYIKAWRANHAALTEIVTSVEKKDYIYLATANGNLMAAQGMVAQALDELRSLMEEAGLLATPPPSQMPPGGQAPPAGQTPSEGQPPA
jgi:phage I-like protein